MSVPDELPSADLGPCCICERTTGIDAIIMLDVKGQVPGHGWGCVVCELPCDGASAVLCDPCLEAWQAGTPLRLACRGYPGEDGRVPIGDLTVSHVHDLGKHLEEEGLRPGTTVKCSDMNAYLVPAGDVDPAEGMATCIGCGCDDLHACVRRPDATGGIRSQVPIGPTRNQARLVTCHWLRLDRAAGLGVCSACPGELVERWDAGERGRRAP